MNAFIVHLTAKMETDDFCAGADLDSDSDDSNDKDDYLDNDDPITEAILKIYTRKVYSSTPRCPKDSGKHLSSWQSSSDILWSYTCVTPDCFFHQRPPCFQTTSRCLSMNKLQLCSTDLGIMVMLQALWRLQPNRAKIEHAMAWVEDNSCPAWCNGWCMVNGTLVPLFQCPHHFGNTFFDQKSNYSMNVQVRTITTLCFKIQAWVILGD